MQDFSARCQVCGAVLALDAAYCGSCGSPRMVSSAGPSSQAPAPSWPGSQEMAQPAMRPEPSAPPAAAAQPSYPPSPSMSAPLPNPYSQPAPAAPVAPSAATEYPPASGPFNGQPGAYTPPPAAYAPPAAGSYASGQYPPPPGYPQAPGYPQSGQLPPPGYGAPGFGQPVYLQVQQPSTSGPVIVEVILGLFGIFGVGWLIGGKTTIGAILLGLSALWWIVSIVTVIFTFGFGALCVYPIDIAFIVASAVTLNSALKKG